VTSTADGTFTFEGISLTVGPNLFVATATDVAGNASAANRVIFRASAAPSAGHAALDWNAATLAAIQLDASTPVRPPIPRHRLRGDL